MNEIGNTRYAMRISNAHLKPTQFLYVRDVIRGIDANRYVTTMALFEALDCEIDFCFVVNDKTTIRQLDIEPIRQYDNTTMPL